MSTYGTMQDRIAREIGRSDMTTAIQDAIKSAIRHYERRRFYFNEFVSSFSTSQSQEYYSTSDFSDMEKLVEIDSMTINVNNSTYKLIERNWSYIEQAQTNAGYTGDPTDYVYYSRRLRLYPIPQAGRTIHISGVKKFTTLSATTDSNVWTTDAEELIRVRAKIILYMHNIQKPQRAAELAQIEADVLAQIAGETQGHMSGSIRPTEF